MATRNKITREDVGAQQRALSDVGRRAFDTLAARWAWSGAVPAWPYQVGSFVSGSVVLASMDGGSSMSGTIRHGESPEDTVRRLAGERVTRLVRDDIALAIATAILATLPAT